MSIVTRIQANRRMENRVSLAALRRFLVNGSTSSLLISNGELTDEDEVGENEDDDNGIELFGTDDEDDDDDTEGLEVGFVDGGVEELFCIKSRVPTKPKICLRINPDMSYPRFALYKTSVLTTYGSPFLFNL